MQSRPKENEPISIHHLNVELWLVHHLSLPLAPWITNTMYLPHPGNVPDVIVIANGDLGERLFTDTQVGSPSTVKTSL